jgi:hypothetical protein
MKKILFALAILSSTSTFSQEITTSQYETAIGAKWSAGIALSFKKFLGPTNALEAQTMFFREGIRVIGLYEFHFYNIEGLNGLAWYIGPGAHVGFWKPKYKAQYGSFVDIGVDGVVGLDYKIPSLPVNLSLDWQPSFGLIGDAGIQPQFGGLGLRYTIN